jgi:hypothetical protein
MKSGLSTAAVVIGLLLLGGSLLWGVLFPASRGWTEDKAKRLGDLTAEAHSLMFKVEAAKEKPSMHAGDSAADVQARYREVKKELEVLRTEFEGKRDSPKTAATFLRWSGIAFVIAGAIIVFANRG